jgi:hypothetical protein
LKSPQLSYFESQQIDREKWRKLKDGFILGKIFDHIGQIQPHVMLADDLRFHPNEKCYTVDSEKSWTLSDSKCSIDSNEKGAPFKRTQLWGSQ